MILESKEKSTLKEDEREKKERIPVKRNGPKTELIVAIDATQYSQRFECSDCSRLTSVLHPLSLQSAQDGPAWIFIPEESLPLSSVILKLARAKNPHISDVSWTHLHILAPSRSDTSSHTVHSRNQNQENVLL